MALTIGFGQSSISNRYWCETAGSRFFSPEVILPNSFISAPAMNVRPAPIRIMALIDSSAVAFSIHSRIPSGTPGLNAFTGGLSMVMVPISLSFVSDTNSFVSDTESLIKVPLQFQISNKSQISNPKSLKSQFSQISNLSNLKSLKSSPQPICNFQFALCNLQFPIQLTSAL